MQRSCVDGVLLCSAPVLMQHSCVDGVLLCSAPVLMECSYAVPLC